MKIGLSKTESRFEKYTGWLEKFNIAYETLDYDDHENGLKKINDCNGLILTGGIDIFPELYCDWDTPETKGTYNSQRDGFELKLFEKAVERKMPVLAICRGLQIVNVYYRGSLIFDLGEIRNVDHKKISKTEDRIHDIIIFENTLLYEITGVTKTFVNSSHHQAIDRMGEDLKMNCKSSDGIIEGIEYSDKDNKPFFLGIQWHPERFLNHDEPASKNILQRFITESENYS